MPDRQSQLRRNRDRKPWDPWQNHLKREAGQAPSQGRNSTRMEPYRGGRKKFMGRRGKKHRDEQKKVNKQRRVNVDERTAEVRARASLAKRAKKKLAWTCSFCQQGIAVSAHKEGTKPFSPHMFTVDGRVLAKSIGHERTPGGTISRVLITVEKIQPWDQMSTRFLRKILRSAWKPFDPKSVLDLIVEKTR